MLCVPEGRAMRPIPASRPFIEERRVPHLHPRDLTGPRGLLPLLPDFVGDLRVRGPGVLPRRLQLSRSVVRSRFQRPISNVRLAVVRLALHGASLCSVWRGALPAAGLFGERGRVCEMRWLCGPPDFLRRSLRILDRLPRMRLRLCRRLRRRRQDSEKGAEGRRLRQVEVVPRRHGAGLVRHLDSFQIRRHRGSRLPGAAADDSAVPRFCRL
mmetsp:Transcript_12835/g.45542  ORF Transcript_12835/g.45542 Transcript_12835/m.45542 type:complete len:212 (-) Transcript_12835:2561-3196(-)